MRDTLHNRLLFSENVNLLSAESLKKIYSFPDKVMVNNFMIDNNIIHNIQ